VQLAQLATPEARTTLHNVLTASSTVRGQLPTTVPSGAQALVIVDDVLSTDWLSPQAAAIALPQAHGYETRLVDGRLCPLSPLELDAPPPTLLQIFSRGNPFRGRAGLSEFAAQCFTRLNAQNSLVGLVVYGSPYVLAALLSELAPTVPHGFTYSQTHEGQAVLLTQLFATQVSAADSRAFTD
jgi:beta-glucosidase